MEKISFILLSISFVFSTTTNAQDVPPFKELIRQFLNRTINASPKSVGGKYQQRT